MFISLKELEHGRVEFSTTFNPGALDFYGADVEQRAPLAFVGWAELVRGEICIQGHLEGLVCHPCDRCLELMQISIEKDLDLFYRPRQVVASEEEVLETAEAEESVDLSVEADTEDTQSEEIETVRAGLQDWVTEHILTNK